jgi:cell division protein FtsA
MSKLETTTGLDIGSGKVTCVIGAPDPEGQGMRVLAGASVPCKGVKGGVVLDIKDTARAVRKAVEKAEEEAKQMVQGIILGVRGKHLESFNNRGVCQIARTDKEITPEDVRAVIQNARAIPISNDREILHVIAQGFSLDRQRGVPDPVGMEGSLLEVEVHIVTAATSHLNNLSKAVTEAGFEVLAPIYTLKALGELVVTPEERDLGCLLVDIGGQTLSIAIYSEGSIKFSKEIPLGSEFITRDLAVGLRTTMPAAEKIKIEHGAADSRLADAEGEISYVGVDGRSSNKVKSGTMLGIIQPRVQEIFEVVAEQVQASPFADTEITGGVVLSGGGSLLRGIPEAAAQILNMPSRLGLVPPGSAVGPEALLEPVYASALALICHQEGAGGSSSSLDNGRNPEPRWVRRVKAFFKDLI